jgi:serine/threonine protein kinase
VDHGHDIAETDAKTLCGGIAGGLWYMHDKGYVHRDLKPANILVRLEPLEAVIADLGVALQGEGDKEHVTTVTHQAPELFLRRGGYNFPCDIWSFGLVCLEVEDHMALRRLWGGLGGDWDQPAAQQRYLERLLMKLTGRKFPHAAPYGALSAKIIFCGPLADGMGSAFGQRFTDPSFGELMRGLLSPAPEKRNTISEVVGRHWLTSTA